MFFTGKEQIRICVSVYTARRMGSIRKGSKSFCSAAVQGEKCVKNGKK